MSDGRAGIEGQVVGLADAIGALTPARIELKRVSYKGGIGALPWRLNLFPRAALQKPGEIAPPWPALWIAAGRATLPLSTRMRRWSGGKTFVVQLQNPRAPHRLFDLIAPPEHDQVQGANVVSILGSPHRVTPARLAEGAAQFESAIGPLPHPRVAVLVGGRSKAFDLSPDRARTLADQIGAAIKASGGSLLMSFSRRTPAQATGLMTEALKGLPGIIYHGEGPNPYFGFLGEADVILVTEDSTNMALEAASTGRPVYLLKMDGESEKFARLRGALERRGVARPFEGRLESWTYEPLRETQRLAQEVLRRMPRLDRDAPSAGGEAR